MVFGLSITAAVVLLIIFATVVGPARSEAKFKQRVATIDLMTDDQVKAYLRENVLNKRNDER